MAPTNTGPSDLATSGLIWEYNQWLYPQMVGHVGGESWGRVEHTIAMLSAIVELHYMQMVKTSLYHQHEKHYISNVNLSPEADLFNIYKSNNYT